MFRNVKKKVRDGEELRRCTAFVDRSQLNGIGKMKGKRMHTHFNNSQELKHYHECGSVLIKRQAFSCWQAMEWQDGCSPGAGDSHTRPQSMEVCLQSHRGRKR